MPFYHALGNIPQKRHTVFRKPDGMLYAEELVGTLGFSGVASLVYHCYPPTMVKEVGEPFSVKPTVAVDKNLRARSFEGYKVQPEKDYIKSRKTLLMNNDLTISLAAPQGTMDYFFKNADADELFFVHKGEGMLKTAFGSIGYEKGDYLLIPRGTIYQIESKKKDDTFLVIEAFAPLYTPKRYRNEFGQLLEHSPFCERDIKRPGNLETHDERGDFKVMIKKQGLIYPYVYATHPFDVVGWDGFHYPYGFSIYNFEPITGRIHLPPPIHQTFESRNFVVCSFVPRLYDYHPQAIPAPYHHSNIDSDEVLYYVDGEFMSRNNIKSGQITLHPGGIPHGPHPGAAERSIGQKETQELAVMIDPFNPLMLTEEALKIEDKNYYHSWLDKAALV